MSDSKAEGTMAANARTSALLQALLFVLATIGHVHGGAGGGTTAHEAAGGDRRRGVPGDPNKLLADKLKVYQTVLPNPLANLRETLRFLYSDVPIATLQYGIDVPELGSIYEGEGTALFSNITYIIESRGTSSFMQGLSMILSAVSSFDPVRLATLRTAYPISRRAAMAFILDRYLTAGPFDDQELLLIQAICARLFKLHRSAAQSKRILEFFHVSKSGGTSICQLGQVNGCSTESFALKQNCMITYFRDVPRWTVPGALGNLSSASGDPWCAKHGRHGSRKWDCSTRRTLMNKFRYNFYSNELVVHDHNSSSWLDVHPCHQFLNLVVFRAPMERIESHLQNILREYLRWYNDTLWDHFDPDKPADWRKLAVPVVDNYMVRSMLGRPVFNLPYGAINSSHLLVAKVVTLQFEVLLTLKDRELNQDILRLGLGWAADLRHLHARSMQYMYIGEWAPEVKQLIQAGSRLDQELYEFAMVVQLLDAMMYGIVREMLQSSGTALDTNAKRLRHCGYVGMHTSRRQAGLGGRGNGSLATGIVRAQALAAANTGGVGARASGRALAAGLAGGERAVAGITVPALHALPHGDEAVLESEQADGSARVPA